MHEGDEKVVFTGDTLFIGGMDFTLLRSVCLHSLMRATTGCGRFFEGTAEEMHHALNGVLAKLPDDTKVYPGSDYSSPFLTQLTVKAMNTPRATASSVRACSTVHTSKSYCSSAIATRRPKGSSQSETRR